MTRLLIILAVLACSAAVPSRSGEAEGGVAHRAIIPLVSGGGGTALACGGAGQPAVAVLVDPALEPRIRAGLTRFENDFCVRGYAAVERRNDFGSPGGLRAYLIGLNGQLKGKLAGAILVGDYPRVYQEVILVSSNPSIPSTIEEVLSFQYYEDLDGVFSASPGYTSAGAHPYSYNVHAGDVDWEIWVGVLPRYGGSVDAAVANLNRYFDKHHRFVSGTRTIPRVFLEITEHFQPTTQSDFDFLLGAMRSGTYAWTPWSNDGNAHLFMDAPAFGSTVEAGYAELAAGNADWVSLEAHGWWGASGLLTIDRVRTDGIRAYFVWSDGCAVGDLDRPVNWLSEVIYAPASEALVAKGTTNNSGGMGSNVNGFSGHNIATAMAAGSSLGAAIVSHVNAPLLPGWSASREFHFGTPVVLGDPTLTIR